MVDKVAGFNITIPLEIKNILFPKNLEYQKVFTTYQIMYDKQKLQASSNVNTIDNFTNFA